MNPYLIGALAIAALGSWGLYQRGEVAIAERDRALDQVAVVAAAAKACTAGVDQAKKVGQAAIAATGELKAAAARLNKPAEKTVERIEKIIEKPAPAGAGCDQAWTEIGNAVEAERKARVP